MFMRIDVPDPKSDVFFFSPQVHSCVIFVLGSYVSRHISFLYLSHSFSPSVGFWTLNYFPRGLYNLLGHILPFLTFGVRAALGKRWRTDLLIHRIVELQRGQRGAHVASLSHQRALYFGLVMIYWSGVRDLRSNVRGHCGRHVSGGKKKKVFPDIYVTDVIRDHVLDASFKWYYSFK